MNVVNIVFGVSNYVFIDIIISMIMIDIMIDIIIDIITGLDIIRYYH